MTTRDFKGVIDTLVDTFWAGGINNSYTAIDEISLLLVFRWIATKPSITISDNSFPNNVSIYALWICLRDYIKVNCLFEDPVRKEGELSEVKIQLDYAASELRRSLPVFQVVYMDDVGFTVSSPHVIVRAHKIIDDFFETHGIDAMGDFYEQLLKTITTIGEGGQYVTPSHIIRSIVEMVAPRPGEKVCDPACGTGGFLLESYQYVEKKSSAGSMRFEGTDYNPIMARLSMYNLIFHNVTNFSIAHLDSLADDSVFRKYDIVMVNPPFSIRYSGPLNDRLRHTPFRTSEQLFVQLSLEILNDEGRAAIIVPEGILFGNRSDFREMLLQNYTIDGIVSLPQGMFKPFTLVKTSILFLSKMPVDMASPDRHTIWFYEVSNDNPSATGEGSLSDMVLRWSQRKEDGYNWSEMRRREPIDANIRREFQLPTEWTSQHFFFVEYDTLLSNNCNLSLSHYKQIEEEISCGNPPSELISEIQRLDREIEEGLQQISVLLENFGFGETEQLWNKERNTTTEGNNSRQTEIPAAESVPEEPLDIPIKFGGFVNNLSFPQRKLLEVFYRIKMPLAIHEAVKLVQPELDQTEYPKRFGVQEGTRTIELLESVGLLEREKPVMMEYPVLPGESLKRNILGFETKTTLQRWHVPEDFGQGR